MTNDLKFQRGLHTSGECDLCNGEKEDASHVLQDRGAVRQVWGNVIFPSMHGSFFQADWFLG